MNDVCQVKGMIRKYNVSEIVWVVTGRYSRDGRTVRRIILECFRVREHSGTKRVK